MNKTILIPILASAIAALPLQAEWNVVSTFDDASALDMITDTTNIEGSNARSEIVDGKWAVYPGDLFESTSNLYALLDMGVDLKAASTDSGGPVTVYFEVTQPTVDDGAGGTRKAIIDCVWGVSNIDSSVVLETRYNSFNVMQRVTPSDTFQIRDGGSYHSVGGGQMFTADTTYKIWVVVDYNLNFYSSYIQGGQWAEQTQLDTLTGEGVALFRVNPAAEDVVSNLMIALSRGNSVDGEKGVDPTYFDNVVIDIAGENLSQPTVGGWNVVSTFDDASALDMITDTTNIEGSNARSEIVDGKWAVYPGDLFESTSNLYALLDMGVDLKAASIDSGGPVTVYYEVTQPTVDDGAGGTRKAIIDCVWGVSNIDSSVVLETRYNSYNVMQRVTPSDTFQIRDGGSYHSVGGGQMFTADTTYKIWVVVDYNLNFYSSYIQGGQWAEQTQLDTLTGEGVALFRVNPAAEDVVSNLMIALSRGNSVDGEKGVDPTYFDNVAYNLGGENLIMPSFGGGTGGGETWAGYPVDAGGNVDTGAWMGWINVTNSPWVYSYDLEQYVYLDEAYVEGGGSWMYILNM